MRALRFVIVALSTASGCAIAVDSSDYAGGTPSSTEEGGAPVDAGGDVVAPADALAADADAASSRCIEAGDRCVDGTVVVGALDGSTLYARPCDLGETWNGTTCGGAPTLLPYNDGNATGGVFVGATDPDDGRANTVKLVAADSDSSKAGSQPHRAAAACAGLDFDGVHDYYLPAANELELAYENRSAVGGFDLAGVFYHSSTETGSAAGPLNDDRFRFSDGYLYGDGDGKPSPQLVRCFRRGP
jgi:hypothetical protein